MKSRRFVVVLPIPKPPHATTTTATAAAVTDAGDANTVWLVTK